MWGIMVRSMIHALRIRLLRIAQRKTLAILLVGLLPLALRLALLPWMPAPDPRVQDEFSHLLLADTLGHGRLVNPVHPMWVHFESMHIMTRPVYGSVFPMAQGAVLAIGKALLGHPWGGVLLSVGCMCAAVCWMLQQWVSPGWAMFGGVMAGIRFGVFSYWMNSYFGGAVAAAAGALVLGAAPGVMRRRDWRHAVVMAVGLAILANSRPYEGAVFSVPVITIVTWTLWKRRGGWAFLAPGVFILAAAGAFLGYYCWRFSGNPLQLPYSFYRGTMTVAPHFIFQHPRPAPVYRHWALREFHTVWEAGSYEAARENRSPYGLMDKAMTYWRFFLGPMLTLPLLYLPWLLRRRRVRLLVFAIAWVCAGLAVEVWLAPHYAAPALALVLLLVVLALRQLERTAPWILSGAIAGSCLLTPVVGGSGMPFDGGNRAAILRRLESDGGRHLLLVRYTRTHDPGDEWVYNGADIDGEQVVWAREMDPLSNRKLMAYYRGRTAWLVEPDTKPEVVREYGHAPPPERPFAFVRLGEDGIDVLRSPEDIKRRVLAAAEEYDGAALNCDQWNYLFTEATGVEAPDAGRGCFPPGQRGLPIRFDVWFSWLKKQQ